MPCTACRSSVESRPLLLKIVIREKPFGRTRTWICARSPSYFVSTQTAREVSRRMCWERVGGVLREECLNWCSACAQLWPLTDFGIWSSMSSVLRRPHRCSHLYNGPDHRLREGLAGLERLRSVAQRRARTGQTKQRAGRVPHVQRRVTRERRDRRARVRAERGGRVRRAGRAQERAEVLEDDLAQERGLTRREMEEVRENSARGAWVRGAREAECCVAEGTEGRELVEERVHGRERCEAVAVHDLVGPGSTAEKQADADNGP
jgi:hypothetical protein